MGNSQALGTGAVNLNSGTFLAGNAGIFLANQINFGGAVTLGGTTTSGSINSLTFTSSSVSLTAPTTLTVNTTATVANSSISGNFAFTLTTSIGTLILTNGFNTSYSGAIGLTSGPLGTLSLGSGSATANALGGGTLTLTNGVFNNNSGNALSFNNAVTIAANAAVALTGGNMTFNGAVTQSGAATFQVNNTTTFTNTITAGANALTLSAPPSCPDPALWPVPAR